MAIFKKIGALSLAATTLALSVSACSSSDNNAEGNGSGSGDNLILANSVEPQNPLVPANTNETGGGKLIDILFSGLVRYDSDGKVENEVAESIEPEGEKSFKVTLKEGQKFSDGTPVKAENFTKAWSYAVENSQLGSYFFEPILGYEEGKPLEGLKVIDDRTFTIELQQPEADFPLRLGYSAFFPLPDSAFDDLKAFGEKPVGNGPYKLAEWEHNQSATLVPNENYEGPRKAKNDGIRFNFYAKQDAAYADLLAGNLDVLDQVPDSAFSTYEQELGDRAVSQPAAVFQSFTIPESLEHFSGEEGKLRRQAISMAVNREEVCDAIFQGTRIPAKDFTSPVLDGYSANLSGEDVLEYNEQKAKELWAKADAISPWSGDFAIAYNADGGHQSWVDATANSIKNTLGINAVGQPYPDFKSLRDEVTNRTITTAFRTGWQADYPSLGNFLGPLYGTGAGSNDGDYSNPEFDKKLDQAAGAKSTDEALKFYNEAQEILLKDLPAIPLWYATVAGGYGENVDNVVFNWKSVPEYQDITKK